MRNRHALRLLQFDRILLELQEYCLTTGGRALLDGVDGAREQFMHDRETISAAIGLVAAYRAALANVDEFPAVAFPDIDPQLRRLAKDGSVLEAEELRDIGRYISSALAIRRCLLEATDDGPLEELVSRIPELARIPSAIGRLIDDEGKLREREIPELRAIVSRKQSILSEIRSLAGSYISSNDYQGWFNSDVPTQKDGRTVLPLKAQFKGRIRGIVHEVSSTGGTLFVEPDEIVERNNALVEQDNLYRQEVQRILRELTRTVASNADGISDTVAAVTAIDVVHCRARYSIIHCCSRVRISEPVESETESAAPIGASLALYAARHPLLGKKAVPIDLIVDEHTRTIIITGPNTGGKTVSLKTVGLLALMHQFGMEIPAGENSSLPIFDDVLAVIGDEQSIEQSLSTFSGHMQNIARVLRHAGERSLVLLDELGAGTDPEEGSALAMAILDELLRRNVFALITTHHTILKNYGYTRAGVRNASMDFDRSSLRPTYRILMGVPGSSHAIEIASGNGLPPGIVEAASSYLADEQTDAAGLIRRLTEKEQDIHRRGRSLDAELQKLDSERSALAEREKELARRELDVKQGRVRELSAFVADTRRELEQLVRRLREGQLTREKTRDVKTFIDRISRSVEEASAAVEAEGRRLSPRGGRVEPGAEVLIGDSGRRGTVVRKARGNSWVISTGAMRVTLRRENFQLTEPSKGYDAPPVIVSVERESGEPGASPSSRPQIEIDLRGMRLEEAIETVDRQIDRAVVHGMKSFGIIHGVGQGVLQQGIRRYLAESPVVESFAYARPEEGGFGKTSVTLKL